MIRSSLCVGRAAVAAAVVVVGALSGSEAAHGQPSYTLVADTSQTAPGANRKFTRFELPSISADGRVAFVAGLQPGPGDVFATGIWSGVPGNLSLVARSTGEAPGAGGATFTSFSTPGLGAQGQVLYAASLTGAGVDPTNNRGLWLSSGVGAGEPVLRVGSPVPGAQPGTTFGDFQSTGADGRIRVVSSVRTPGGTTLSTSFVGAPGQLEVLAQVGGVPPGLSNNVYYSIWGALPLGADDSLLHAVLATTTSPTTYRHGLWAGKPGALTPVAVAGTPAPVGDPRITYGGNIFQVHTNSAGQVAFLSQLANDGRVDYNTVHLFSGAPGNVQRRLSEGDAVPGVPGAVFNDLDDVTLGRDGGLTFFARIAGPSNPDSLWSLRGDALRMLLREGQAAPGVTDGATFGTLVDSAHAANAAGQIALTAKLRGTGVTDANDLAIYLTDADGELTLIAREGAPLPGDPGGKVVSSLFWSRFVSGTGGDEGLSTVLNDAGQLAFTAQFADGSSAVYIAHVPEPGLAVLGWIGGAALLTGRGRRAVR